MYTKDKAQRITLRLNEEQFNFVKANADILGVSPSEFMRMVVNASMATTKQASERLKQATEKAFNLNEGGLAGRENDEAHIDGIV